MFTAFFLFCYKIDKELKVVNMLFSLTKIRKQNKQKIFFNSTFFYNKSRSDIKIFNANFELAFSEPLRIWWGDGFTESM